MSPALLRKIAENDAREATEAAREERWRAQLVAERHEAVILDRWREDVALGIATARDLPRYQAATVGRTHSEALQAFRAEQDAEDARMQAAVLRYGQKVAAMFGADGDAALARLLESDERVPARQGRERGWG